jgi:pimeloyl-ACP methyl ester carboxylesterase
VLWGQHASQTPLREAEQVRALRPDAKFEVFAGGDLPHEESPTAFTEALLTFMQPR